MNRRHFLAAALAVPFLSAPARAADADAAQMVLSSWYRLILLLVRHTATYSPPVASRAFAYLGITAHEVAACIDPKARSLAGQLNGLDKPPYAGKTPDLDLAHALHAALTHAAETYFANTGPTGQRTRKALTRKLSAALGGSVPDDVAARSENMGKTIAMAIHDWSKSDGGDAVVNLGFPDSYTPVPGKGHWVPTSKIALQQAPLLPDWGKNRTFAMPNGASCSLPPPPEYSEDKASAFYTEMMEVYEVSKALTDEQKMIARFWSDDPMLSPTPPGHWISIVMQIAEKQSMPASDCAALLAKLGVAIADGFIGCWQSKYEYNYVRPVTVIRELIDPAWNTLLITPPFPEYPSGHSTQSGAAAALLASVFGDPFPFTDATHVRDGLAERSFKGFYEAADEAAISRLYGGIHFRAAIEKGVAQGKCIGAYAAALKTKA